LESGEDDVFYNPLISTPILDQILHYPTTIYIKGKSERGERKGVRGKGRGKEGGHKNSYKKFRGYLTPVESRSVQTA
jgi:hypothetical protein